MAGSLYTQKPLALARMAWCSPPAMLAAWSAAPSHTPRAAASVAPATSADASCMPGNTGLSLVPSPNPDCRWPAPAARTASR